MIHEQAGAVHRRQVRPELRRRHRRDRPRHAGGALRGAVRHRRRGGPGGARRQGGPSETWRGVPTPERARLLFAYQDILKKNQDDIARLLCRDTGKTWEDARGEVWRGIEVVEHACSIASLMMGETVENVARGIDTLQPRPAPRRLRRDHAVQLPGHDPAVDVPAGRRLRQHLRAEALGAGPDRAQPADGAAGRGRRARRAGAGGPRRPGAGRRAAGASRRARRQLRGVGARCPPDLRQGGGARQAGAGPGRRQEPPGGPARRRPRAGHREPGGGGLRRRGPALHGDQRRGAGRRGPPAGWTI